ncbi:MAG: hypothetical protein AW07_02594 [Candidatus Accumulibacter sp. SK-11]|nr:MAG: hypothetical protein AW07_02594 [Candidatus Accumulibacter sp. SK-11]
MNGRQTAIRKPASEPPAAAGRAGSERSSAQREPAGMPRFLAAATVRAKLVRVHQGATAANANTRLGARAFTHGSEVWLGERQRPDDVALMMSVCASSAKGG